MVDLLKQKSKIIMQHRERKTFAPADVFKQRKIQPADAQPPPTANKKQEESKHGAKEGKKIQATILEKYDVEMEKKWVS